MNIQYHIRRFYNTALLLLIICLTACTPAIKANSIVFNYEDFGPQVTSYELIGKEWYQWDNSGSSDPNERYDVKVVVYKGISLQQIQQQYPVINGKQDYRYLEYSQALKHLDKIDQIEFEIYKTTKNSISKKTRERILKELGK